MLRLIDRSVVIRSRIGNAVVLAAGDAAAISTRSSIQSLSVPCLRRVDVDLVPLLGVVLLRGFLCPVQLINGLLDCVIDLGVLLILHLLIQRLDVIRGKPVRLGTGPHKTGLAIHDRPSRDRRGLRRDGRLNRCDLRRRRPLQRVLRDGLIGDVTGHLNALMQNVDAALLVLRPHGAVRRAVLLSKVIGGLTGAQLVYDVVALLRADGVSGSVGHKIISSKQNRGSLPG